MSKREPQSGSGSMEYIGPGEEADFVIKTSNISDFLTTSVIDELIRIISITGPEAFQNKADAEIIGFWNGEILPNGQSLYGMNPTSITNLTVRRGAVFDSGGPVPGSATPEAADLLRYIAKHYRSAK